MLSGYAFTQLNHAAIKGYAKINLHTKVVTTHVSRMIVRNSVIAHVKRAKLHSCTIAANIVSKVLSRWCPVVLELNGLIGHIARSCCYRV